MAIETLYSIVNYTGDGTTKSFTVPFPYLYVNDVHLSVEGEEVNVYPVISQEDPPSGYEAHWYSSNTLRLVTAPASDAEITIQRITNRADPEVEFENSAILTEEDLNLIATQLLYIVQEAYDNFSLSYDTIIAEMTNISNETKGYRDTAKDYKDATEGYMNTVSGYVTSASDILSGVSSAGDYYINQITSGGSAQIADITSSGNSYLNLISSGGNSYISQISSGGSAALTSIGNAQTSALNTISSGGSAQVYAVTSEGNTQVARLEQYASGVITNATTVYKVVPTTLSADVSSGATLTTPTISGAALPYWVGKDMLGLSYNGVELYKDLQYQEVGSAGTTSYQVKTLMPMYAGDQLCFKFMSGILDSLVTDPLQPDGTSIQIDGNGNLSVVLTNQAITQAIGYTAADDSAVVKLTGNQTISGEKTFSSDIIAAVIKMLVDNSGFIARGGTDAGSSALVLYGKSHSALPGCFTLRATKTTQANAIELRGQPDGTLKWNGQTIQTSSDERLKTPLVTVPDSILDAWGDVQWGQFKFLNAITEKGEKARLHLGLIAQRIKTTFEEHGLDACEYGILCYDEEDDIWMIRYEEALCIEAAYQRRRAERIEAKLINIEQRIAALEGEN